VGGKTWSGKLIVGSIEMIIKRKPVVKKPARKTIVGTFGNPKMAKFYGGKKLYQNPPAQIECSCNECKEMCLRHPCWGTPKEMLKLIELGYGRRLMMDYYFDTSGKFGRKETQINIITPALVGYEGSVAPFGKNNRCTFLNSQNLCEIHNIKPIEGKIASHACERPKDGRHSSMSKLHLSIVNMWATHEGEQAVKAWNYDIKGSWGKIRQ
jgi:hypothetical protein